MKKIIMILLSTLAVFCITACQQTPDSPIVVNKNLDNLADVAVGETDESAETNDNGETIVQQLGVPDKLTIELASSDQSNVKIHTDAPIIVPETTSMPTARVGIGRFSEDDVKNLFYTLCGDVKVIPNNAPSTQAKYMRIIQDLMQQKEDGVLDKYGSIAEIDAAIEDTKRDMAQAPENYEQMEPDFSMQGIGGGEGGEGKIDGKEVTLRTSQNDGIVSELTVYNAGDGLGLSRAEYYRDTFYIAEISEIRETATLGYRNIPEGIEPAVDEQSARQTADQVISSLGLSDFVCSGSRLCPLFEASSVSDEQLKVMREFMYTRSINGTAVTYTNDDGRALDDDSPAYVMPWMYEKIRIVVDEQGVFLFIWNSPYMVKEILTDHTSLLDFEEIQNVYEKMAPIVFSDQYSFFLSEDNTRTFDIYITGIRLGLARVTEKNVGSSGLLVPVWDFFGYDESNMSEPSSNKTPDAYNVQISINAIDGSIVDRELGY